MLGANAHRRAHTERRRERERERERETCKIQGLFGVFLWGWEWTGMNTDCQHWLNKIGTCFKHAYETIDISVHCQPWKLLGPFGMLVMWTHTCIWMYVYTHTDIWICVCMCIYSLGKYAARLECSTFCEASSVRTNSATKWMVSTLIFGCL